jgi:hypothetical protein
VIYLKTWGSTKDHAAFWKLHFILVAFFIAENHHNQFPSLPVPLFLLVLCQVCLVGWSMGLVFSPVVISVLGTSPSLVLGPSPTYWINFQT